MILSNPRALTFAPFSNIVPFDNREPENTKMKRMLDFGCGSNKRAGAIGADITRGSAADVIVDFEHIPFPFKDDAFDHIVFHHVIEHLTDILASMEEIWRISAPDACLEGATPHFSSSSSYSDPTHRHHLSYRTFDFLSTPSSKPLGKLRRFLGIFYRYETPHHQLKVAEKFQKIEVRITFNHIFHRLGIEWLANIYPELYESFFAFILPARDIVFRLKVIKQKE